jgi:hypothetical protein
MKAQFEDEQQLGDGGTSITGVGPLEKAPGEQIKYFVAWVTQGEDAIAEGAFHGDLQPVIRDGKPAWELELRVRGSRPMEPGRAFGSAVIVFEEDEGLFSYTWTYPVDVVAGAIEGT